VRGVGVSPRSHKQKILGSNPVAVYLEESAKDSAHLCLSKLFRSTQPDDRETVIEG
jgi:hypothetical protein